MNIRQRLEALQAEDAWWSPAPNETWPSYGLRPTPIPHWRAGVAAAVGLHVVIAGLLLLHHQGVSAPSPGTSARPFDVIMLAAWPEPGHRVPRLGVTAKNASAKGAILATRPDAEPIGASALPETQGVKPPPDGGAIASPAPVQTFAQAQPRPLADSPPSTPSAAETLWETDVLAKLAAMRRYPARALRAGEQDTVMVRFVVDRDGQLLSADVIKSKGLAALDAEALALIHRAAPLPPPPLEVSGDAIELIAPVQFILHRRS
jgi:protein TonB